MPFITISKDAQSVHSDIRGPIYEQALALERQGETILKLNTGNPAAFGFRMPESVKEALSGSVLEKALGYCDVRGQVPAREAILHYHTSRGIRHLSMEDIYICNGVSEAVNMALSALLSPGDEVLVPMPCYSLWTNCILLCGAKPVFYVCDEASGWNPDVAEMEKLISPKTKAIVMINPNNPTGAVYNREIVERVVHLAEQKGLILFSDEIYDRLVFSPAQFISAASVSTNGVIVTMSGLSKSHCMCGFRCGWMVFSGKRELYADFIAAIQALAAMRLCANAIMQLAIPAALKDTAYTQEMISAEGRLEKSRQAVFAGLDKIEGVSYVKNQAAFYLFPKLDPKHFSISSDRSFAQKLLQEQHILVVPGSGFSQNDPYHFRIVMLPEENALGQAMDKLGTFLETNKTF